jgi:3-methyladenine DNA glycosylase/8-oxoguanine DNA glycosylase
MRPEACHDGDVLERTFRPARPVDLRLTLSPLCRGRGDPTMRIGLDGVWRATRTPAGPATMHITAPSRGEVRVRAWGDGAAWVLDAAPGLVGADDDDAGFASVAARHPVVADAWRRFSAARLCRSQAVTEALVPTIIEQKVVGLDARQSYRGIVRTFGDPAPGPAATAMPMPPLLLPPSPARLAGLPGWAFHRFNVERRRADVVRIACRVAHRLEESVALGPSVAHQRLRALPGIGPWSAGEAVRLALGDPDSVSIGDYHLPSLVTWSLAGEPRGTDERMLELLEPWRGQRARVVRLLELGGSMPPRRGPRMPRQNIAAL